MAVSSITNRQTYQCNGSSTVFPFPYFFFNPSDLAVYLFDTGSSVIYPQTFNTNYTVSGQVTAQGTYPSGGNVVMTSAAPSNLQLIITRNPAQIQNYQLYQNAPINSLGLTQQLDYLTGLVQRLQDEVSRCLQIPDGLGFVNPAIGSLNGSTFSQVLPPSIALLSSAFQVLTVNSGATGWTLSVVPGIGTIIPVVQGGTGNAGPYTQGGVMYAQASSLLQVSVAGAPGQVLIAGGSSAPSWGTVSIGSGTVTAGSIQGILGLYQGGTNTGSSYTYPVSGLIYASGSAGPQQFQGLNPGGQDQVLTGVAALGVPVWGPVNLASGSSVINALPVARGGTNQTTFGPASLVYASTAGQFSSLPMGAAGSFLQSQGSSQPTWNSTVMTNPMSAAGDMIYGSGASAVAARLPGPTGSSAPFYLTSQGTGAAANTPQWSQLKIPTVSMVSGSSHSGNFSANLSGTYTTPAGVLYLKVKMAGGGGGGGGSCANGNSLTTGSSGGLTVFGSSLVMAFGGTGAPSNSASSPAPGGTSTVGSGAISVAALVGSLGGVATNDASVAAFSNGAPGGATPFFNGADAGGMPNDAAVGANSYGGGGGGGGGPTAGLGGYGGASGAYTEAIIPFPAASYAYSIGLGGAHGLAGTGGRAGGDGFQGVIIIEEFYQ